jgi:hypothetical protein
MIEGEGILKPLQLETITRCPDELRNGEVIEPCAAFVQAGFKLLLWMLTKVSPPNSKDEGLLYAGKVCVWGVGWDLGC